MPVNCAVCVPVGMSSAITIGHTVVRPVTRVERCFDEGVSAQAETRQKPKRESCVCV